MASLPVPVKFAMAFKWYVGCFGTTVPQRGLELLVLLTTRFRNMALFGPYNVSPSTTWVLPKSNKLDTTST